VWRLMCLLGLGTETISRGSGSSMCRLRLEVEEGRAWKP